MGRLGVKCETSEGKLTTEKINVGKPDVIASDSEAIQNKKVGQTVPDNNIKEISVFKQDMGGYFQTTKTDAGWNYNVGKSAWNIDVLAYKEIAQLPTPIQDRFISDMAQNRHFKDRYVEWVNNILKNGTKNVELEKTLTWLSPALIKQVRKDKYNLETPIIVMSDKQVGHSGMNKNVKQALTEQEYLSIYDIVNNPDEIYYDYTQKPKWEQIAFVRLIPNSDKCIKVCVRMNQKSRTKDRQQLVNKVTTVGKVNYMDTFNKSKDYKKIK